MKRFFRLKHALPAFLFIVIISLVACDTTSGGSAVNADSADMAQDTSYIQSAEAVLSGTGPDTTLSGQARFQSQPNGQVRMLLEITVAQKANSTVAVHLHEHGDCGDMGNNAHGHWNPTNENHGRWGQGNYHSGDIGNLELDNEGKGIMEMTTDRWTIGGDSTKNILNKAVIVHSGVDDYTTQPTGNAGSRIGCGVINQLN